ncbi:hypothetical protein, partial [Desulfamplus magnetovallimortis]|uniref:hypothetical protein n=1 Tax=Desulfamplus magnetovallimortis TaxID=1246637 RepID=UPI0009BB35F1
MNDSAILKILKFMKKAMSIIKGQISRAPLTIEPLHSCKYPNEACEIYNGSIVVESYNADVCTIGCGNIIQQWLPEPSIKYCMTKHKQISSMERAKINNKDYLSLGKSKSTVTIHMQPISLCPTRKNSQPEHSSSTFSGAIEEPVIIGTDKPVQFVKFHIVNFNPYEGQGIRNSSKSRLWKGRIIICCDKWKITIDASEFFSKELREKLLSESGYAITHVAQAEKLDGSPISLSESDSLQDALFYFLSFTQGRWAPPILPAGYDETELITWKRINPWNSSWCATKWQDRGSWLPTLSTEGLIDTFPGFFALWNEKSWKQPISQAINWYIYGNLQQSGLNSSIIIAQACLELFSWVIMFENGIVDKNTFNNHQKYNTTSKKINRLLESFNIPQNIPHEFVSLKRFESGLKHSKNNGPYAIVEIRNSIVHASPENRETY